MVVVDHHFVKVSIYILIRQSLILIKFLLILCVHLEALNHSMVRNLFQHLYRATACMYVSGFC